MVTQARPPAAAGALAAFLFLLSWAVVLVSAILAYGDRRAVAGADGPGVRVVGKGDACGAQLVDQACSLAKIHATTGAVAGSGSLRSAGAEFAGSRRACTWLRDYAETPLIISESAPRPGCVPGCAGPCGSSAGCCRGSTRAPIACSKAYALPRSHSRSSHPSSSRSTCRGSASSECQAATRSRAGSAGPRPPTSRIPVRRPSDTSTLPGMRSP